MPANYNGTNAWLAHLVKEVQRHEANLPKERHAQLDELGITWTGIREDQLNLVWNETFDRLRKFKEEHGHLLLRQNLE